MVLEVGNPAGVGEVLKAQEMNEFEIGHHSSRRMDDGAGPKVSELIALCLWLVAGEFLFSDTT